MPGDKNRRIGAGAYVVWGSLLVTALGLAAACSSTESRPAASGLLDAGEAGDAKSRPLPRALCVDGRSVDGDYPKAEFGFDIGTTLADLSFETAEGSVALRQFFEPCAASSRLLVLRVTAAWCGPCRWHADHTKVLAALDVGARLVMLDLLVADAANLAPRKSDLDAWAARVGASVRVASDPDARLMPVNPVPSPLPLYVFVDTRRMAVVNYLNDPDPELLELRIRQELALVDGAADIATVESTKIDGMFYRNQWEQLLAMTLPTAPPPDPSNAKADDPAAAALGKKLFTETGLSAAGVSCASCHEPSRAFASDSPQAVGVTTVDRNAPSVLLAAHSPWQFWDGRADSLWMQALGPIENADEMGATRLEVGHALFAKYKAEYEAIWGALPDFADGARFPAKGKPGDASWQAMTTADRDAATRVFVNAGKSIAAFERTLRMKPNRLDAYAAGDASALTTVEKQGLFDFFVAGCVQCHFGPRLTNDAFHIVRFPTGRRDGQPDRGRVDGVASLLSAEFNSASAWSDAPSSARLAELENRAHRVGAFKTPALRGVADTAPFGHGGTVPDIKELTVLYGKAGLEPEDPRAMGTTEPWVSRFSEHHRPGIEAILNVMSGLPVE